MGEVKKMFLLMAGVAVFILAVGLFSKNKLSIATTTSPSPTSLRTIKVGNKTLEVFIADTDVARRKGLGGVTSLADNQGMLFVFSEKNTIPSFWMKDMKIPLDMIWVKDAKIIQIDANIPNPAEGTPDNQLKVYSPGQSVNYVLEVNAGWSSRNNVKINDSVGIAL